MGSVARIELAPAIPTDALPGLDAFSDVEIVYVFDRVGPGELTLGSRHPRGNAAWRPQGRATGDDLSCDTVDGRDWFRKRGTPKPSLVARPWGLGGLAMIWVNVPSTSSR